MDFDHPITALNLSKIQRQCRKQKNLAETRYEEYEENETDIKLQYQQNSQTLKCGNLELHHINFTEADKLVMAIHKDKIKQLRTITGIMSSHEIPNIVHELDYMDDTYTFKSGLYALNLHLRYEDVVFVFAHLQGYGEEASQGEYYGCFLDRPINSKKLLPVILALDYYIKHTFDIGLTMFHYVTRPVLPYLPLLN
jgi:hypothetical protein